MWAGKDLLKLKASWAFPGVAPLCLSIRRVQAGHRSTRGLPSHRRKQGLDLGGSWVLELGTFKPVSPGGWGWIQWGWRWMWWWPVLCPRVRQLLWWGSSALTGCLCLPWGPYIRHKLSPGLMFDFVWRINIRLLECCAPTKPSSPERAASAKTDGGGDGAGE